MRLKVAAILVEYYDNMDLPLTSGAMVWTSCINYFQVQWKSIMYINEADPQDLPKMENIVSIVKWIEAYVTYLQQEIGARNAPLAYVIREDAAVPAADPDLVPNAPHSTLHVSLKEKMIYRLSHIHALFRGDNGSVFGDMEAATRGMKYVSSTAPFKRTKNGRASYMDLKSQQAKREM